MAGGRDTADLNDRLDETVLNQTAQETLQPAPELATLGALETSKEQDAHFKSPTASK